MKLVKVSLIHEFINEVYYFTNKQSAKAFIKRNSHKNYKTNDLYFKVRSKFLYSVRSVGNRAYNVGEFATKQEAKAKSQQVGTARPGAYSDIHSYPIYSSYKQVTNQKTKFIGDYSRSAIS